MQPLVCCDPLAAGHGGHRAVAGPGPAEAGPGPAAAGRGRAAVARGRLEEGST